QPILEDGEPSPDSGVFPGFLWPHIQVDAKYGLLARLERRQLSHHVTHVLKPSLLAAGRTADHQVDLNPSPAMGDRLYGVAAPANPASPVPTLGHGDET